MSWMKRFIANLLILFMVISAAGSCAEIPADVSDVIPVTWKEELFTGDWLDISSEKMTQPFVTGTEMMALLDQLVAEEAPDRLNDWMEKYQQLRNFNQPLKRFDAMGMVYLACWQIGGDYSYSLDEPVPEALHVIQTFPFDGYFFSDGLFADIDGPKFSLPFYGDTVYLDFASMYYNALAVSPVSGEYPFPYYAEKNSINEWEPPTYLEAILAVIRLRLRKSNQQPDSGPTADESPAAAIRQNYTAEIEGLELEHAAEYGMPLDKIDAPVITGREMMVLLDAVVAFHEESWSSEEWLACYPELREWDQPLTRFDAMAMAYLTTQYLKNGWEVDDVPTGLDAFDQLNFSFDGSCFSEGLFDRLAGQSYPVPGHGDNCPLDMAALYWNLFRTSLLSGQFPFSLDWETMSIHEDQPPTYKEGVLAAVRLYESSPVAAQRLKAKWLSEEDWAHYDVSTVDASLILTDGKEAEILSAADRRRDEILNSPTQIVRSDVFIPGETYTGTAYYVSENGDDSNDGLTPETAWKTVHKVTHEVGGESAEIWVEGGYHPFVPEYVTLGEGCVRPGDAVFFERGGIYRMDDLDLMVLRSGITFSAFGEGPKPIISGSPESGTGREKWSLYYSDDSGVKIWQYDHDMKQISQIILDGKICATRVYEWWTENGWRSLALNHSDYLDLRSHDAGVYVLRDELLSVEASLTQNHTLISRPDLEGFLYPVIQQNAPGPLYLRCDEGNPGDLFESVEFVWAGDFLWNLICCYGDNTVLDNLSVRYFSSCCASTDGAILHSDATERGTVIQNCEFAYGGGHLNYSGPIPDSYGGGDCVYGFVCDSIVRNCYFHDMDAVAVGYETHNLDGRLTGYHYIQNNLLERCLTGIRIDPFSPEGQYLDSVRIEGNMVLWSGKICPAFDGGRLAFSFTDNHFGESVIRDNVFYLCEEILMYAYNTGFGPEWSLPIYSGNIFVQYADRPLIELASANIVKNNWQWFPIDEDILDKTNRFFGENGAEIFIKLR